MNRPPSTGDASMARILCVDDEPATVVVLEDTLKRAGHEVLIVHNVSAALNVLARGNIDLIISDYRMPGATGLEFLGELRERRIDVPLIMVTGYASVEHAVAAMKAGAIDYVTKPIRGPQLEMVVEHALEFVRLRRENEALRSEVSLLRAEREIIGESPEHQRIMKMVTAAAPTRATVLLQGDSGTGKELLARALHSLSDRAGGPFITVNCAALPDQLVESIMFGHEKGAFTGAVRQVHGAFERAHRGTLLLDEISEMRLDLQAKLLRALQEQEFERVGGSKPIQVDVRVVATTNRDLAGEVRRGTFRADLYYRLNVMPIRVPPLRERRSDIPLLVHRFVARAAAELGRKVTSVAPEALELLVNHEWPGNVRELAHAVERAVILTPGSVLEPSVFDLLELTGRPAGGAPAPIGDGTRVPNGGAEAPTTLNLGDLERQLIQRALRQTHNNRTRAAALLGISVRTLRNKLNRPDEPESDE
jgi:DNA-binding NtrC family response regulator